MPSRQRIAQFEINNPTLYLIPIEFINYDNQLAGNLKGTIDHNCTFYQCSIIVVFSATGKPATLSPLPFILVKHTAIAVAKL